MCVCRGCLSLTAARAFEEPLNNITATTIDFPDPNATVVRPSHLRKHALSPDELDS
jgi:hypothetical protein